MTLIDSEPRYRLNKPSGVETLHSEEITEECEWDDATDREWVDPMTAEAMLVRGDAVACRHCKPRPVG